MKLNSPSFHSRHEAKWQMFGPHWDAWAGVGQPRSVYLCIRNGKVWRSHHPLWCLHYSYSSMEEREQSAYSTQSETESQHSPPHPSSLCLPQNVGIKRGATNQTCVNITPIPSICPLNQRVTTHDTFLRASSSLWL